MKHYRFFQILCTSILFSFFATSCYKEDSDRISNGVSTISLSGKSVNHFIPEANILLGQNVDGSANSDFTMDIMSNAITTIQNPILFDNYSFKNMNEFYTSTVSGGGNSIDIFNVNDGSKLVTYTYSYLLEDCAVSNNKIYTIESSIGPSKVHVYNLLTNAEIANTYVGSYTDSIAVSNDGTKIFTFAETTSGNIFYTLELTSSNQLKDIKVGASLYPFALADSTFCMSANGKRMITNNGIVYNDSLKELKVFSPSSFFDNILHYYVTPDASKIAIFTTKECFTYNANSFELLNSYSYPQAVSAYFHVIPYYSNNQLFGAFRYYDALSNVSTLLLKIN